MLRYKRDVNIILKAKESVIIPDGEKWKVFINGRKIEINDCLIYYGYREQPTVDITTMSVFLGEKTKISNVSDYSGPNVSISGIAFENTPK